MGLGATGCGYEYTNLNFKCPHLNNFKCLKYKKDLNKSDNIQHPIRLKECHDQKKPN